MAPTHVVIRPRWWGGFTECILTTALYTRRFRLISETLRQAEAGTYQTRPSIGVTTKWERVWI